MPYNWVKKINAFIGETKLIGVNKVRANDDEELDENELKG